MNFTWLTDNVHASDSWIQNDMTCFVFQHPSLGHWNGYVITNKYIPYDNLHEIDVHGGITLNQSENEEFLYGFDTAHYDDTLNPKSKEWVIEETKRFAQNIADWYDKGNMKNSLRVQITRTSLFDNKIQPHEKAIWDEKAQCWYVEVESIEDILKIHDPVVLTGSNKLGYEYKVELYDDYRE